MNIRRIPVFLLASVAATSALTARAGTYTANVPEGTTQTIDAAFVAAIGADDLVKTGRGTLVSSADMAAYTGTITVREGAFEIKTTSDLGTGDGGTFVEDGGTLVVNMTSRDQQFGNEVFTIAGAGDAAYGAAIYQSNRGNDQNKLLHHIALSDDATISSGTHLGLASGELTMNGHTLTITGAGIFTFRHTQTPAPVGNLVSEIGTLLFRGGSNYTGNPSKTLTIRNGSKLVLGYSGDNAPPIWWELVVEEGGKVAPETSSVRTYQGNVSWNATTENGVSGSLVFAGEVTGTGTIKASNATLTFAQPLGAGVGLGLSGTAKAALAPAAAYSYTHKGLMTGFRADCWDAGLDQNRSDTRWSYCSFGPGPQLTREVYYDGTYTPNSGKAELWCSRGYIWNREATNVTYTIFCGCVWQTRVRIDGTLVYTNNRDSWSNTYSFEVPAGTCKSIDIRTQGSTSETSGPRNDNDKLKINGVIANDPRGYYFTTNAVSTLETPALPTLALADNGALDANNMAMSVAALAGGGIVTNVTTLTVSGSWTLAAADVADGDALTVYGDLAFGNGCTFDGTDLRNLELGSIHTVCTAASIAGFTDTEITDGNRTFGLVKTGTRIDLVSLPNATVIDVR